MPQLERSSIPGVPRIFLPRLTRTTRTLVPGAITTARGPASKTALQVSIGLGRVRGRDGSRSQYGTTLPE